MGEFEARWCGADCSACGCQPLLLGAIASGLSQLLEQWCKEGYRTGGPYLTSLASHPCAHPAHSLPCLHSPQHAFFACSRPPHPVQSQLRWVLAFLVVAHVAFFATSLIVLNSSLSYIENLDKAGMVGRGVGWGDGVGGWAEWAVHGGQGFERRRWGRAHGGVAECVCRAKSSPLLHLCFRLSTTTFRLSTTGAFNPPHPPHPPAGCAQRHLHVHRPAHPAVGSAGDEHLWRAAHIH